MTIDKGDDLTGRSSDMPELARGVIDIVRQLITEVRPRLITAAITGQRAEAENRRHQDNFLTDFDLWMHDRYKELLIECLPSFIYASEEADPEVIGEAGDPDLCVLVDPLDTSEMAVRALYGYTQIVIYSRSLARPVVAVVGDIFHHVQIYVAARDDAGSDRAYLVTADGDEWRLDKPSRAPLSEALVTNYLMRPAQRFRPLAQQDRLLEAIGEPTGDGKFRGRIGVDFGSIGLCHVAAGFTDAMIEFAKGFAIWDLLPGHYILHAAGGVVTYLDGTPLPLNNDLGTMSSINRAMNERRKFIAAGNQALAEQIRESLRA